MFERIYAAKVSSIWSFKRTDMLPKSTAYVQLEKRLHITASLRFRIHSVNFS